MQGRNTVQLHPGGLWQLEPMTMPMNKEIILTILANGKQQRILSC